MSKRRCVRKKPVKYYSKKRRAVYAKGDPIDPKILFELHNWMCWVCKEPINRRLRLPNYYAATVEHIVPLSKGGEHVWSNVAVSHAICNFNKGDSQPGEFSGIMTA